MNKFTGKEYECKNFKITKDGRCKFNGAAYSSLDDLMNGIKLKHREEMNRRKDINTFVMSASVIGEAAFGNDEVRRIKTYCEHEITSYDVSLDNGKYDLYIIVPEDVQDLTEFTSSSFGGTGNVSKVYDINKRYSTIYIIGGSGQLHTFGSILQGIKAERLDVSKLFTRAIRHLNVVYSRACFDELDLSWTKNCDRIESAFKLFGGYKGKKIDLRNFNSKGLLYTGLMFSNTEAEIIGIEELNMSKVKNAQMMFMSYCNKQVKLDLSNWNTLKLQIVDKMFCSCTVNELNVTGWNTGELRHAGSMFHDFQGELKGLEKGTSWTFKKLNDAKCMFKQCKTRSQISIDSLEKVTEASEMFREARIADLSLSGVLGVSHIKLRTDMFFELVCETLHLNENEKYSNAIKEMRKEIVRDAYIELVVYN